MLADTPAGIVWALRRDVVRARGGRYNARDNVDRLQRSSDAAAVFEVWHLHARCSSVGWSLPVADGVVWGDLGISVLIQETFVADH